MPPSSSLNARVIAHIVDVLQNGVRPWVQPWDDGAALALPLRYNGLAYRGFNVVALWTAAAARQFTHRHWLSFKQAHALGGHVRRGERATHITYFAETHAGAAAPDAAAAAQAPTPAPKRGVILRTYAVFNAAQIDDLPAQFYAAPAPVADCDETSLAARFARVPAQVTQGGARACYDPSGDVIHLPPRHSFVSTAQYFATLLHELAHWTGARTRLAREAFTLDGPRATAVYAREELVAELTAAFLGAELGLPVDHLECHAAYLDHWLKSLDRDPGALLTAAGHAQRAADFLRPFLGLAPSGAGAGPNAGPQAPSAAP